MAIPKFEDFLYPFLLQLKNKDVSTKELQETKRLMSKVDNIESQ